MTNQIEVGPITVTPSGDGTLHIGIGINITGLTQPAGGGVTRETSYLGTRVDSGATTPITDLELPAGTSIFLVSALNDIVSLKVDAATIAPIAVKNVGNNWVQAAYAYTQASAGTPTITVNDGGSSLQNAFSAFHVVGYNTFAVSHALPVSSGGVILATTATANAATFIPTVDSGTLTEHFNQDVRTGENVYVGSTSAGSALSGSPAANVDLMFVTCT